MQPAANFHEIVASFEPKRLTPKNEVEAIKNVIHVIAKMAVLSRLPRAPIKRNDLRLGRIVWPDELINSKFGKIFAFRDIFVGPIFASFYKTHHGGIGTIHDALQKDVGHKFPLSVILLGFVDKYHH